jgi:hypothetical protein
MTKYPERKEGAEEMTYEDKFEWFYKGFITGAVALAVVWLVAGVCV